jgi:exopolysaccharide biosynthesis polyprenyl glycosylphosphotransferase
MPIILGPVWLVSLILHHCYEQRVTGAGAVEFRRVFVASVRLFAYLAIACYVAKVQLARGYVAIAFPIGSGLLVIGRSTARALLRRHRRRTGSWVHRVLAIGDGDHVEELIRTLHRDPEGGFSVVAACVPGEAGRRAVAGVPAIGTVAEVTATARDRGVDTIAITGSRGISSGTLRQLSWDLEGSGISMVVAPALTDVAGPRISIRPVAGLPLLHVDEPDLGAVRRVVKRSMDLTIGALMLLLLLPAFGAIAVMVRLSSPGPIFFQQTRIGAGGREFCLYKFRSMYADAEARLSELRDQNDASGLLFKLRHDPRVTPVGRWLRKFSLDEFPQLLNVLKGDMSLVGPRPPLPEQVSGYDHVVVRRLRVEPGMTGLWQVSGRSDLSWEDAVRLDLYYVENWSPLLDLSILFRTILVVLRGAGAY